jgi:predicted PurR-regulated permease PerM
MGLFLELILVAVLNSIGLLILGLDYAILLGILGAVLNLIPYVGGIVGTFIPMLVAAVTKDSYMYAAWVMVIYAFVQFIDNNVIVPRIVASRVKLNGLVSIIIVIIGNALWGVSGMFLAIPVAAISKVIMDQIEPLKPWGFLLGNSIPTLRFKFNKLK